MDSTEILKAVCGRVTAEELMSGHTYYKIGGPARYFAVPENCKELSDVLDICVKENIPYFILGCGSNVLVSDRGFNGCVIDMSEGFNGIEKEGILITAGAGCRISKVAKAAAENSLAGFEELAGIPGTVGGALVMNAGCYGRETAELVHRVNILDSGSVREIPSEEIEFGYRRSELRNKVIISAVFRLSEGKREEIIRKMAEYSEMRKAKQPVSLPSCGSVFKRPAEGFAGALIEDCGLKGKRIGGAMVSDLHAGFIVNTGGATASDVMSLIRLIKNTVYAEKGILLEEEVLFLGFEEEECK